MDLVVHHPLSLSQNWAAEAVRASLNAVEEHKVRESEDLCHGNGWLFSPMGWHPWAGVGPHGAALRARLEKQIAGDLQGWPRRHLIQNFCARLTFALMAFVAKQLRAAEDALPEPEGEEVAPPVFRGGPVFSPVELTEWDRTDEEETMVGPIRVRVIRPGKRPGGSASQGGPVGSPPDAMEQEQPLGAELPPGFQAPEWGQQSVAATEQSRGRKRPPPRLPSPTADGGQGQPGQGARAGSAPEQGACPPWPT